MANKPVNRFEVQLILDGDAYVRVTSRKGGVTARELIDNLKRFINEFEPAVIRHEALPQPDAKEPTT